MKGMRRAAGLGRPGAGLAPAQAAVASGGRGDELLQSAMTESETEAEQTVKGRPMWGSTNPLLRSCGLGPELTGSPVPSGGGGGPVNSSCSEPGVGSIP